MQRTVLRAKDRKVSNEGILNFIAPHSFRIIIHASLYTFKKKDDNSLKRSLFFLKEYELLIEYFSHRMQKPNFSKQRLYFMDRRRFFTLQT